MCNYLIGGGEINEEKGHKDTVSGLNRGFFNFYYFGGDRLYGNRHLVGLNPVAFGGGEINEEKGHKDTVSGLNRGFFNFYYFGGDRLYGNRHLVGLNPVAFG